MAISTKTQILNAAEDLFAENGFSNTSLRAITSLAGVNLASVNYHFGSKKLLIQAVLKRYLDVFVPQVDAKRKILLETELKPSCHQVFALLEEPLNALSAIRENGTANFVQILGRGYSEAQGHLRKYIMGSYGQELRAFSHLVHQSLPHLPPSDIFWRLHFAIGTFVFSMSSSQALTDIAQADFDQTVSIEGVTKRLIPFITAGVAGEQA